MNETLLRLDYEAIRTAHPDADLPTWEEMTPDERENHKRSRARFDDFMTRLGESIRTGGPLPREFE